MTRNKIISTRYAVSSSQSRFGEEFCVQKKTEQNSRFQGDETLKNLENVRVQFWREQQRLQRVLVLVHLILVLQQQEGNIDVIKLSSIN